MKKHIHSAVHEDPDSASRRLFLAGAAVACMGVAVESLAQALSGPKRSTMVTIEEFSTAGKSLGRTQVARISKSDGDWRKLLPPTSYEVTRKEGTENQGSGKYLNNHASGIYRCICCDTAVFDSQTKFESGTGWPSFWQPISRSNIVETTDRSFGMTRIAVSCARCDGHLGHLFDDGPKPTGLRYCMNSVALSFVKRA